jgi:hypothetical protein
MVIEVREIMTTQHYIQTLLERAKEFGRLRDEEEASLREFSRVTQTVRNDTARRRQDIAGLLSLLRKLSSDANEGSGDTTGSPRPAQLMFDL